jgi:type IV pilus assembly protein PilY1
VCQFNTSTYSYPDATYKSAVDITTGPYYYTIGVGQYCTDDTMKNCKSTSIGAAPAGYPVPVKVRWCSDKLLTQLPGQAGRQLYLPELLGAGRRHRLVRHHRHWRLVQRHLAQHHQYRDCRIGRQRQHHQRHHDRRHRHQYRLKQQTMASLVAANIIARSTTNQYYACVKTPTAQPTVPACSVFGITLTADNVVAVVPVTCTGTKSLTNCVTVNDSSRAGWGFTVSANSVRVAPAYVTFSGTTANSGSPAMGATSYNATSLFSSMSIGRNQTAAQVAALFIARSAPAAPTRPMPAATQLRQRLAGQ